MKKILWSGYRVGKSSLLLVVYGIFFIYILHLITTTPLISTKVIFGVIGFAVLGIAVYFEYLKRLYSKMIYQLTVCCDSRQAQVFRTELLHKDWFKGFKKSLILFDALLLMDQGAYQECLKHLKNNGTFFHTTLDYLFIYHHTQLHIGYFLNDLPLAQEALTKLAELKKQPTKKISPLFSWAEISGIDYFLNQRYSKSKQAFEAVNTAVLNPRETVYYYYMKAQTLAALKEQQAADLLLQTMNEQKNTIQIGRRKPV